MQNEQLFFSVLLANYFFGYIVKSSQVLFRRPHLESTFFSLSLGESRIIRSNERVLNIRTMQLNLSTILLTSRAQF